MIEMIRPFLVDTGYALQCRRDTMTINASVKSAHRHNNHLIPIRRSVNRMCRIDDNYYRQSTMYPKTKTKTFYVCDPSNVNIKQHI